MYWHASTRLEINGERGAVLATPDKSRLVLNANSMSSTMTAHRILMTMTMTLALVGLPAAVAANPADELSTTESVLEAGPCTNHGVQIVVGKNKCEECTNSGVYASSQTGCYGRGVHACAGSTCHNACPDEVCGFF